MTVTVEDGIEVNKSGSQSNREPWEDALYAVKARHVYVARDDRTAAMLLLAGVPYLGQADGVYFFDNEENVACTGAACLR